MAKFRKGKIKKRIQTTLDNQTRKQKFQRKVSLRRKNKRKEIRTAYPMIRTHLKQQMLKLKRMVIQQAKTSEFSLPSFLPALIYLIINLNFSTTSLSAKLLFAFLATNFNLKVYLEILAKSNFLWLVQSKVMSRSQKYRNKQRKMMKMQMRIARI